MYNDYRLCYDVTKVEESMSKIVNLARAWLTRNRRPFIFTDKNDEELIYMDCENLGLYVHIPFCKSICSFCPYCKTIYDKEKCNSYIDSLLREIELVCKDKPKKDVTSLYFGGGTPVLALDRLEDIISELEKHFSICDGIGVELHPSNVDVDTLRKLKSIGVTKISIGIQSFQKKYQNILGRNDIDIRKMADALKQVHFETVSMDFIFALPTQTADDLKKDIDVAFESGANHIAIYPFIDFTFTKSSVKEMPKKEKRKLLDEITNYCYQKGLKRDSIWTFSKDDKARYSSMTRDCFLGFGCSATTLLKDSFKINTFDTDAYCEKVIENTLPTSLTIKFTLRQRMVYYLFWKAYSTQVDSRDFEDFFEKKLSRYYGFELFLMKAFGLIKESNKVYKMTLKGAFYYHYFENFYTLSYIDKMWSVMRKEAFPKRIEL